jgi:Cu/Ag efflux protein CusF
MKEAERMSTMNGTIGDLDVNGRRLTIKGLVMNKTFEVPADVIVVTVTNPKAALSDLKTGEPVDVTYEQHQTAAVAHRIDQASAVQHQKAA